MANHWYLNLLYGMLTEYFRKRRWKNFQENNKYQNGLFDNI